MSIVSNQYITIKIKDCDKPNELKECRKFKNCETTKCPPAVQNYKVI